VKPRLRGVLHQHAFVLSVALGGLLVVVSKSGTPRIASTVFAVSVAAMFGVSALYHRGTWQPRQYRFLRRLDHAMVFALIAGTYTPVGLLVLSGAWRIAVLGVVWGGALGAIVLKLAWVDSPTWVGAVLAVALGWVGVAAFPLILEGVGAAGMALLLAGGLLYTGGSVVYALRRPDPVPAVFGYHELFHTLVIAAAACQYAAVALLVSPYL
jgi:hemolysin III